MAPGGYGDRVEGVHAVRAAIAVGRVERLYVEEGRVGSLGDLLGDFPADRIETVGDVREMAETSAPQGVVAVCAPLEPRTLEDLTTEPAAILVLDHLEDPRNVGAMARSAWAAGATGLVMSSRRAAPLSAAAFKAAAGALEHLPVSVVGSIPVALSSLKDLGVWVVGLDTDGDQTLFGLDLLTEPVAVVVGAEGRGLAALTVKRCDLTAYVPMIAEAESLNASVSAALAVFEIMRARSG